MSPQKAHKQAAIEPLLQAFPQRRFILVGDSGEQDPEIYGHFLRAQPEQILHVYIRSVRGNAVDRPRLEQTFAGLPERSWTAYETASDLASSLIPLISQQREA